MRCPFCNHDLSFPKTRATLREMLDAVAAKYSRSPEEIVSKCNIREMVEMRREFAVWARQQGYSLPEIGRTVHRHHSTVVNLLKGRVMEIPKA